MKLQWFAVVFALGAVGGLAFMLRSTKQIDWRLICSETINGGCFGMVAAGSMAWKFLGDGTEPPVPTDGLTAAEGVACIVAALAAGLMGSWGLNKLITGVLSWLPALIEAIAKKKSDE